MRIESSAFTHQGEIPAKHTCEGQDSSPPLAWSGAPAGTQGFAVVMLDTSLAAPNNVHWVIYDLAASVTALPASIPNGYSIAAPVAAHQTKSSFNPVFEYLGPCPPPGGGAHDYELTLYAVDAPTLPGLDMTSTPQAVIAQIVAHKVASTKLVGKFAR